MRRVYVRRAAAADRPPAWPGPGWVQWPEEEAVPADGDVLVIVDADASSAGASLRDALPLRVDALHFHGRTAASRAWLHELPAVGPASLALDTPPPAADLPALAACGETLRELRLGHRRAQTELGVDALEFLHDLPNLDRLHLHDIDLRGRLGLPGGLPVRHLVARLVQAPDATTWPWRGLEWLEAFPDLRTLELGLPRVDPASLRHLACLRRLTSLELARCRVTADALGSWASLTELRELNLYESSVEDGALPAIGTMPALRALRAAKLRLGEPELSALASLPDFEDLTLEAGQVDADVGLLSSVGLRALRLVACELDERALGGLERLDRLETLDVADTTAGDAAVAAAAALPRLADLSLAGCADVTAIDGEAFQGLRSLDISATAVEELDTLADLPQLETLRATDLDQGNASRFAPSLRELHLDRTAVGPRTVEAIAACPRLQVLTLEGCALRADDLTPLEALSDLRSLAISPRDALPAALPALKSLLVEGASLASEQLEPLSRASSLVWLELRRCRLHDDVDLAELRLERLEALSLPGSQLAGTGVLRALPPALRQLDVTDSDAGDEDIEALHSPTLEAFTFFQTAVTMAGVLRLGETPRLDALYGSLLPRSEDERQRLLARFPACWTLLELLPARVPDRPA